LHLKHLGPVGLGYLTDLFNLSVKDAVILAIWKVALILLVPKPEKPTDQGSSFKPISLLSPAIKILERLLLSAVTSFLQAAPSQHGFRQNRSTTMALLLLCNLISEGFNRNKPAARSVFVAIDISKAFNTVDITLLLEQIASSSLHHNYVRWLSAYLRGRKAACIFQGHRSKF
jgi:hypothetical protein